MRSVLSLALLTAVACSGSTTVRETTTVTPIDEPPPVVEGTRPADGRLPTDVRPTRYALDLAIDPRESDFSGTVVIDVELAAARSVIWLHAVGIEASAVSFQPELPSGDFGEALAGELAVAENDDAFASITLPEAVEGKGRITIAYRAPFGTTLGGIYKVEHAGESYAFTQMEPLSARHAFPSFDEPGFKTPFEVTLRVPADQVAAANGPESGEPTIEGDTKVVRFATTPPIPTYLFALAVGPLDVVEGEAIAANEVRDRPLPFRGLAPKGRGEEMAYTMANTAAILTELETYFGIPYPYAKLDFVAVPDFEAGAMENVGLVTFRDTILLVDEERTPTGRLRFWAYIVAHELAHMWFGNLVTMQWWDDLWLNEAFASWMEHVVVARWRPDYEADVELLEWVTSVMDRDSLSSARAIRQPIESSHDIHNAFDGITYGKGAGVLAMFEESLGEERFRDGIRAYLREHSEGNATAEDLFRALGAAAEREVTAPFESFVTQSGVPLVTADLDCSGESPKVTLTQTRYLPAGSPATGERSWQIPVCIRHGGDGRRDEPSSTCGVLSEAEGSIALEGECPDWIHPNADGIGYYRWSLDDEGLAALRTGGLRHLSTTEKLSLVDSLTAAFAANAADGGAVVEALLALAGDDHRAVASAPLGFYEQLLEQILDATHAEKLRARLQRAYGREGRRLGWAGRRGRTESEDVRLRRSAIVGFLATQAKDRNVRREGERLGRAYVQWGREAAAVDTDAVPADLAVAALTVAVQEGDAAFFEHVLGVLSRTEDGAMRENLLRGLGATEDAELGARAMALSLEPELRVNEVLFPVALQLRNPTTRATAWAWLKEHFDVLVDRLPPSYAGYLPQLMSGACEAATADAVQAFFESRVEEIPGGPRNLAAATESIRLCVSLASEQRPKVHAFLD